MEGVYPRGGFCFADEVVKTGFHFLSGFFCERHREDIKWGNAVVANEVGDAMGNHTGLAAPRTGQEQQRTLFMLHRLALDIV